MEYVKRRTTGVLATFLIIIITISSHNGVDRVDYEAHDCRCCLAPTGERGISHPSSFKPRPCNIWNKMMMMMILHVIRKSKFSAELAAIKISCCVVVDLSTFVTQEGAVIRLLMKEGDTDHTTLHATTITTAITITNTNTAYSANSKLTTLTGI